VTGIWGFVAGAIVGGVTTLVAAWLWRRARVAGFPRQSVLLGVTFAGVLIAAALVLYATIGSRSTLQRDTVGTPPVADAPQGAAAKSMDAAVAALEARLARGGGSEADWTLLAQAYEFQGRSQDAQRARAHQITPSASLAQMSPAALLAAADEVEHRAPTATSSAPPVSAAELQVRTQQNPRDAQAWAALAEERRKQRDNAGARDALQQLIALHAMTAQTWADYADVLASLNGGSLAGGAGEAIDKALALDPANTKALWLKASQAHEQQQFSAALQWWKKLRAALPPDSPDLRIIEGNIAEDTQLAGLPPGTAPAAAAPTAGVQISGTVSIDAALAARVAPGSTLFIYAKAADSPGPPLAVLRAAVSGWPVRFTLDDSMAMVPSRRLSQFDKVIIEARISRSGQAAPNSGDLFTTSAVLTPHDGKPLVLVINREIS
jgi:cytochrome c-type biogenesis protein CcmH/NrfG